MVLLLQNRTTMTGAELAAELEVSERTVARDALALSEAGVPVYAERGRSGGYRLVGGYRTRLTGLGRSEVEALFLSGVPGALREMGLADAASAARLKVRAALVPSLADAGDGAAQRFHLDAPAWWRPPASPGLLPPVAAAVWEDRVLLVGYRRRDGAAVERELEPYGLVLKAGVWYLAARPAGAGEHRVYRVDRFTAASPEERRFARDTAFDLPGFWERQAAAFARSLLRERVELRLTPAGRSRLRHVVEAGAAAEALAGAVAVDGADGPGGEGAGGGDVRVTLGVESLEVAFAQLTALGAEVEVLGPPALRARFAAQARRSAALYPDPDIGNPA
nr:WYL domain-containing protein [Streptomyces spiramenti]